MAKDWIVANRAIKFHKGINDSDINKIARKAAKRHREILGKSPFRKMPTSELNYLNIPVYHYQGQGLEILDEVITQYCFEHEDRLNSQIEQSEKIRKQRYDAIKNSSTVSESLELANFNPEEDEDYDDENIEEDVDFKVINGFTYRVTEFDDVEVDNIEDIPF